LSRATAVSVAGPSVPGSAQLASYGALVSTPSEVVPSKNSTSLTPLPVSAALATRV
jgi:hypothetical protein